eukprot:6175989-Pleurochrysis_carterae.AAC.2
MEEPEAARRFKTFMRICERVQLSAENRESTQKSRSQTKKEKQSTRRYGDSSSIHAAGTKVPQSESA